jgi:outer membrane protein insertion porin family
VPATAQETGTIASVDVDGSLYFDQDYLSSLLTQAEGEDYSREELLEDAGSILKAYHSEGYLRVELHPIANKTPEGIEVTFQIEEGARAEVGEVTIAGASALSISELDAIIELEEGSPFEEGVFRTDLESILREYENAGYPYASVAVADFRLSESGHRIDYVLAIEEGPVVRIGSVTSDSKSSSPRLLENAGGVRSGELYNQEKLERLSDRLWNLGLFESVGEPSLIARDVSTVDVVVPLVEGLVNNVDAALGYDPTGGQGSLSGLVDVSLRNIAGTGRKLDVSWFRPGSGYSEIEFDYVEPWPFGLPLEAGISLRQSILDTLYSTFSGELSLGWSPSDMTRLEWGVGTERGIPSDTKLKSTEYYTSIELQSDGRDFVLNPSSGSMLSLGAQYATEKREESAERYEEEKYTFEFEGHLPLYGRHVVSLGLSAGIVRTSEEIVPFHERFTLGGSRDLRGYREQQFRSPRIGLASVEYAYLPGKLSRLHAFVDLGIHGERKGTAKLGYGFGLRVPSGVGIISLDYGLGENDTPLSGKIHFSLQKRF